MANTSQTTPFGEDDSTRGRTLQMAAQLARRPSTARFTLEQLAEKLGVHYTAIYHYFNGKGDLERTLVEAFCVRRNHLLEVAQRNAATAIEQLSAFIRAELDEPPTVVLARSTALLNEPHRRKANAVLRRSSRQIAAHLERGIADGSVRAVDTRVAAEIISRILNRYRNREEARLRGSGLSSQRISAEIVELIRRGMLGDESRPYSVDARTPHSFPHPPLSPDGLERVLSELTAELNAKGYEGTSIPRVAKALGVSKTSIYKYATTKEELLYLCAWRRTNLVAQVRQLSNVVSDDPLEALLYNLYFSRLLTTRHPGPLLREQNFRSLSVERQTVMWEIFERQRDDLVDLIERGIALGLLRPLETRLVLPIMSISSAMPIRGEPEEAGFRDEVVQFMLRGIGA